MPSAGSSNATKLLSIKVSDRHLVPVISLDLGPDAVFRRPVQPTSELCGGPVA